MDTRWRNLLVILVIVIIVILLFFVRVGGEEVQRQTIDSENIQKLGQLCADYNVDIYALEYFGGSSEELSKLYVELGGFEYLTENEKGFRNVIQSRVGFFKDYYILTEAVDEFGIDLDNFKVDCALKNTYLDINLLIGDVSNSLELTNSTYSEEINLLYVNFKEYDFTSLNSAEIKIALNDLQTQIGGAVQICD